MAKLYDDKDVASFRDMISAWHFSWLRRRIAEQLREIRHRATQTSQSAAGLTRIDDLFVSRHEARPAPLHLLMEGDCDGSAGATNLGASTTMPATFRRRSSITTRHTLIQTSQRLGSTWYIPSEWRGRFEAAVECRPRRYGSRLVAPTPMFDLAAAQRNRCQRPTDNFAAPRRRSRR